MNIDPSGYKWHMGTLGWILAGVVVLVLVAALVVTTTSFLSFVLYGSAMGLAGIADM